MNTGNGKCSIESERSAIVGQNRISVRRQNFGRDQRESESKKRIFKCLKTMVGERGFELHSLVPNQIPAFVEVY